MKDTTITPRRIQRKRTKGWRKPENAIIVDRTSRWGNPYYLKEVTVKESPVGRRKKTGEYMILNPNGQGLYDGASFGKHTALDLLLQAYKDWVLVQCKLNTSFVKPLKGKNLVCFCPSEEPCHADVLLELANQS